MDVVAETLPQTVPNGVPRGRLRFGYNHNFRHRGHLFHVQTEDSGQPHEHIYSHIFFAGTVIASRKTNYDRACRSQQEIQALMRESHRAMCVRLRDGIYDEQVDALIRKRERPTAPPCSTERAGERNDLAESLQFSEQTDAEVGLIRECLARLEGLTGFLGAALVDPDRGASVRALGSTVDMQLAVSGNAELLSLKMELLERLELGGTLEDILITIESWFCIIRPLAGRRFLYVIVDRDAGNLALARRSVSSAAAELSN